RPYSPAPTPVRGGPPCPPPRSHDGWCEHADCGDPMCVSGGFPTGVDNPGESDIGVTRLGGPGVEPVALRQRYWVAVRMPPQIAARPPMRYQLLVPPGRTPR